MRCPTRPCSDDQLSAGSNNLSPLVKPPINLRGKAAKRKCIHTCPQEHNTLDMNKSTRVLLPPPLNQPNHSLTLRQVRTEHPHNSKQARWTPHGERLTGVHHHAHGINKMESPRQNCTCMPHQANKGHSSWSASSAAVVLRIT